MAIFDIISLTPSAAVATNGTMTFTYPSGDASRYSKSGEKLNIVGLQAILSQAADTFTLVYGTSSVVVTYKGLTSIPAGTEVKLQAPRARKSATQFIPFFINLADITAAGDVVTNYTPGFAFEVLALDFITSKPVTTAAKLLSLNVEIGTTDVTGGVVALTSALATPMGKVINGSGITGAKTGTATDNLSIEATAVTAFAEGSGWIMLKLLNLDTLNEYDDRVES